MPTPSDLDVSRSPFSSILNFRDVGATINQFSHAPLLQSSLLYRSARPDDASLDDTHALRDIYRIHTILDLRSKTEHIEQARKQEPQTNTSTNHAPNEGSSVNAAKFSHMNLVGINLNGGGFTRALLWRLRWSSCAKLLMCMAGGCRMQAVQILSREVMEPRGLIGLGKDSVDHSKGEIRQVFEALAVKSNYPLLLHCTQGKDRTGLIVILLLRLLDVPVSAIEADYRASEGELEVEREERIAELRNVGLTEGFADCPADFVEQMLSYVEEKYGGVLKYLESCGVGQDSLDTLKRTLLQPQNET